MVYGLRIRNNNLEIQIDGQFLNYTFNGQAGSGSIRNDGSLNTITLTNPSLYPPIILLRPTGDVDRGVGVLDYVYSAGYYTGARIFGGRFKPASADYAYYDYRVYVANEASSENYGLRIRNAANEIVYDSGRSPFKILDVATLTVGNTYSHGAYSNPFYIFSPWLSGVVGWGYPYMQGPVYRVVMGIAKQSSTSVKGDWIIEAQIGITNMSFESFQATNYTLILCAP